MLSKDKLARINELAKKKKNSFLEEKESQELNNLRSEYIENLRKGFRNHIEGLKIVDEEGNDVTPDKLKMIQKEKGLHDR